MKTVERQGAFIKQFVGPGDNQIICFKFWQAVVASGCPGECSYCFLQTQSPYRTGRYDLMGTLFSNLPELEGEAIAWLARQKAPTGLIVGENQDGLAFEGAYKKALGVTPLEILIPLFSNRHTSILGGKPHVSANHNGHTLIVLSKFTSTQYAENYGPSPNVIFSWSLSLPSISRQYEKHVASLDSRLDKAAVMKRQGYRVRFRLDALAPIPNWEKELADIMKSINAIGPEMLTIGALRATSLTRLKNAAQTNGRDIGIFDYLADGKDPSKFKHRTDEEFHVRAFRMVDELRHPSIALGLCKEDLSLWQSTGVEWAGCHCLHSQSDPVTAPREKLLQLTRF